MPAAPIVNLLSNDHYRLAVTAAGGGFSACGQRALTRWQPDNTCDAAGFFVYLQELDRRRLQSLTWQPTQLIPDDYQFSFAPRRAEFNRRDGELESCLSICLHPEHNVELRRCRIRNCLSQTRHIALTSYLEPVLQSQLADAAHPAFSKLFLETMKDDECPVLFVKRRPRLPDEQPSYAAHFVAGSALVRAQSLSYETDRVRFIGRGRSCFRPQACDREGPLSETEGGVLDPIASWRIELRLEAREVVDITFALAAGDSPEEARQLARQFSAQESIDHTLAQAEASGRDELQRLQVSQDEFHALCGIDGRLLYQHGGTARGDPPTMLCQVTTAQELRQVKAIIERWQTWYGFDIPCHLTIAAAEDWWQPLQNFLAVSKMEVPVRPYLELKALQNLSREQFSARRCAADIDLCDGWPVTESGVDLCRETGPPVPNVVGLQQGGIPSSAAIAEDAGEWPTPEPLLFDNGYGGFSPSGREYVIRLRADDVGQLRLPPMPWSNVISNEQAGFVVTETGAGYTWFGNSREYRLTPWSNDPVCDPFGEALYLRDEEDGTFWSPLPGPVRSGSEHETRHGWGYTRFRHQQHDIAHEVWQFVPRHDPVKVTAIRLTNHSSRPRRLRIYSFHQWVLGTAPAETRRYVQTGFDRRSRTVVAWNPASRDFPQIVAFAGLAGEVDGKSVQATGNRTAFLGRHGRLETPRAVQSGQMPAEQFGTGLDPCAALAATFELPAENTRTLLVLLGAATTDEHVGDLLSSHHKPETAWAKLSEVREFWQHTVSAVQVQTPCPEIDLLVNGWLPYQNLSCRMWGRSSFYQGGGAFGFRDQLQDAAALIHYDPDITRRQLLLHAAHQYEQGDVMHWWHPPHSRGLRTRFSDDLLWLPYLAAEYVQATGNGQLWETPVPFVRGPELDDGQTEVLHDSAPSTNADTLYEHCCRAVDRSLKVGPHDLPLMGSGDWNDGMNCVGHLGRGESVWLGFFLYDVLGKMLPVCRQRDDQDRAASYQTSRDDLRQALNTAGWDGAWYRRAFLDDGTPLGSGKNDECQIDAIAQAWAAISGAAPADRVATALESAERQLVDTDAGIIRLLTPPFDRAACHPGYIKGYLPGIRENGGQYTHGVLWLIMALAEHGNASRAAQLLSMISPASHTRTEAQVQRYRTEPYTIAADVYGWQPHIGRGGWTWYTGSAGWYLRVVIETVFGLRVSRGEEFVVRPRLPSTWKSSSITYRLPDGATTYLFSFDNPGTGDGTAVAATVDGVSATVRDGEARIRIVFDRNHHTACIRV